MAIKILMGIGVLLSLTGLWLHWKTRKHVRGGNLLALRKDSLLRRRDDVLKPEGQFYVGLQRLVVLGLLVVFVAIIYLSTNP